MFLGPGRNRAYLGLRGGAITQLGLDLSQGAPGPPLIVPVRGPGKEVSRCLETIPSPGEIPVRQGYLAFDSGEIWVVSLDGGWPGSLQQFGGRGWHPGFDEDLGGLVHKP